MCQYPLNFESGSTELESLGLIIAWDKYGKTNWITAVEFPELTLKQTQELLTIQI